VTDLLAGAAVTAGTMFGMGMMTSPILRRLPEPAMGEDKPHYADLASPRLAACCALLAGVGVATA
jgi:hypothetical protein